MKSKYNLWMSNWQSKQQENLAKIMQGNSLPPQETPAQLCLRKRILLYPLHSACADPWTSNTKLPLIKSLCLSLLRKIILRPSGRLSRPLEAESIAPPPNLIEFPSKADYVFLCAASLGITQPLVVASSDLENFLQITVPAPFCLCFPTEPQTLPTLLALWKIEPSKEIELSMVLTSVFPIYP